MKRTSGLRRLSDKKARDASGRVYSTLTPSGKPIKKVNPEKRAKRKQRQAAKHRAYMRSETRREVERRSAGQCEAKLVIRGTPRGTYPFAKLGSIVYPGVRVPLRIVDRASRCENKATDHHHKTYARYGGDELPEDMLHVCKRCHEWFEAEHPTRRAARRPVSEN